MGTATTGGIAHVAARIAELQQRFAPAAGFATQLQRQLAAGGVSAASAASEQTGAAMVTPVAGRVTSRFGPRIHPISGEPKHHDGVDVAASTGTSIVAGAAGTVTFAGARGGYGNLVIVEHGDGLQTRYAHAERIDVAVGQRVSVGERIATVGSTGNSTGPHLHFEVRVNGSAVDPQPYLAV